MWWVIIVNFYSGGLGLFVEFGIYGYGNRDSGLDVLCNFVVLWYLIKMIQDVKYLCDLVEENVMFFRLDYKVVGVGMVVCGLGVREDLLVKVDREKEVKFVFNFGLWSEVDV